jgi:glycerol dehydrogenase-like iron-containing ADH family enzyme
MQLPRQVIIGDGILNNTMEFIRENILKDEKFALITGENVKKKVGNIIEKNFLENNLQYQWIQQVVHHFTV